MAGTIVGSSTVFEKLLDAGKKNHKCTACNRHLDEDEMVVFEAYVSKRVSKTPYAYGESVARADEEGVS